MPPKEMRNDDTYAYHTSSSPLRPHVIHAAGRDMAIAFLPSVIYHIQAVLILIVPASYVPGTRYHTTWCRHGCDFKEMGTLFVILLLINTSFCYDSHPYLLFALRARVFRRRRFLMCTAPAAYGAFWCFGCYPWLSRTSLWLRSSSWMPVARTTPCPP